MKTLLVTANQLKQEGRWDIDYHLPPEGILAFPKNVLKEVSTVADVVRTKRDPGKQPEALFQYVDISSVDVETGVIARPQELLGEEAPSRARKVIQAYDIIISTCRPTRGAIAVVPEELHGQICSTGFSVIRAKDGVNPFYLHFALRMASTLEQFRKWSTGSSYPAILDDDVLKTLIPVPSPAEQDEIAKQVRMALVERERAIQQANAGWESTINGIVSTLAGKNLLTTNPTNPAGGIYATAQIKARLAELTPVGITADDEEEVVQLDIFGEAEATLK